MMSVTNSLSTSNQYVRGAINELATKINGFKFIYKSLSLGTATAGSLIIISNLKSKLGISGTIYGFIRLDAGGYSTWDHAGQHNIDVGNNQFRYMPSVSQNGLVIEGIWVYK